MKKFLAIDKLNFQQPPIQSQYVDSFCQKLITRYKKFNIDNWIIIYEERLIIGDFPEYKKLKTFDGLEADILNFGGN